MSTNPEQLTENDKAQPTAELDDGQLEKVAGGTATQSGHFEAAGIFGVVWVGPPKQQTPLQQGRNLGACGKTGPD